MKTIFIFILICVFNNALTFSQIPITNLVGKYSFNGNANNEAGNNVNGYVSGATLTSDRCGNANSAYHFNGNTDYISVSNFKLFQTSEITISLWAKAEQLTSNCMIMLAPDDWNDRCVACAQYVGSPTYLIWDFGNCSSNGRTILSGPSYNTQWHHYVFITSYSQNMKKIYVDNVCVSTQSFMGSLVSYTRDLYIGGGTDWSGGSIGFTGKIDDIRIYDRGISASEVTSLFNEITCGTDVSTLKREKNTISELSFSNPCNGLLHLSFKYPEHEKLAINIYNSIGKLVYSENEIFSHGKYNQFINLKEFAEGMYFIGLDIKDSHTGKCFFLSK